MVNTTMTISQSAGTTMPMIARDRVASVRVLPVITGVVCRPAAGEQGIQGTAVRSYRHLTDAVAVVKGVFPGTSAWSPPIQ